MLPNPFRRLTKDRRGSVAMMIAIMGAMLIAFAGLAVEVSNALSTQRKMQAAADSAAISAANAQSIGFPSPYTQEGFAIAAADNFTSGQTLGCPATTATQVVYVGIPCDGPNALQPGYVEALIKVPFTLQLAHVVFPGNFVLHGRAVAKAPTQTGGSCTLALQGTGTTITASGNGTITYGGCSIAANSTSANAINTNGTNSLIVGTGVFTGGAESWGSMNIDISGSPNVPCSSSNPSCVGPAAPRINPYADLTAPTCGSYQNTPNSGTIGTVGATVNCYTSITLNNSKSIDLVPGTYVINGTVKMTGGSLTCSTCVAGTSGVTIFLVGNNATVDIQGGTTSLVAQPTGPAPGVLFYTAGTCSGSCANLTGGPTMTLQGAIVLPNQDLKFAGNTSTSPSSICAVLVANTMTFTGTSNVGSSNCSTFNTKPILNPGTLVE